MVNKLIVYSIPKCGTHFVSQIIALLLNKNCNIYNKKELYKYVPHLTNTLNMSLPFFSTHPCYVNYKTINVLPNKKIFIIRNPLDKMISDYFFYVYYRINKTKLNEINRNLNKHIFQYCVNHVKKVNSEIINHIKYSKRTNNSVLFDYNKLNENKKKFIKLIANMINININDDIIDNIYNKIDIKKCNAYEKRNNTFKVGAVQNGLFFREGSNKGYLKYLTSEQINYLKTQINPILIKLYGI